MHAMFLLGCSDCFSVVWTERGGGRVRERKTKLKQSEDTFTGLLGTMESNNQRNTCCEIMDSGFQSDCFWVRRGCACVCFMRCSPGYNYLTIFHFTVS